MAKIILILALTTYAADYDTYFTTDHVKGSTVQIFTIDQNWIDPLIYENVYRIYEYDGKARVVRRGKPETVVAKYIGCREVEDE